MEKKSDHTDENILFLTLYLNNTYWYQFIQLQQRDTQDIIQEF